VKKTRRRQIDLPKHIADAIRGVWSDGVIDIAVDRVDAPFWEVYPKLKAALSHIPQGAVFYEREPEGGSTWGDSSDPDEDLPHRARRIGFVLPVLRFVDG